MKYKITVDGEQFDVEVKEESGSGVEKKFRVETGGKEYEILASREGAPAAAPAKRPNMSVTSSAPVASRPASSASSGGASSSGMPVEAPMAGKVVAINVKQGDPVKAGDVVAILEAMKMENAITSPVNGKVTAVSAAVGTVMKRGDVIVRIEAES